MATSRDEPLDLASHQERHFGGRASCDSGKRTHTFENVVNGFDDKLRFPLLNLIMIFRCFGREL